MSGARMCIPWHGNKYLEGRLMSTPANVGYLYAAILFAIGFILVIVLTTLSNLIAPSRKTKEKLQTYESGETPIGSAWVQYPFGFFEILFFIVVLALGLAYAWRKGVIRWI